MKKSSGNVLLIFIMLVGLSFIVFSLTSLVTTLLRESMFKTSDSQAFYIAEAGINKAVWYLATSVLSGGKSSSWRGATTEAFGRGTFSVTVMNTALSTEVFIISTGDAFGSRKTIQQVSTLGLPPAFDYSLFAGNSNLRIEGSAIISGDLYVNGNTTITGSKAEVTNGDVSHPEGYSVVGNAVDGGVPEPLPTMPAFDTSYYDAKITAAEGVAAGDVSFSSYDLAGGTLYVNGNVTITGNGTITGPGVIVATGALSIIGTPNGDGSSVTYISKGTTEIAGTADLPNSIFYARADLKTTGNIELLIGTLLTSGNYTSTGNMDFSGVVYCAGEADIGGDPTIRGSVVANTVRTITGNPNIIYDASAISQVIPPGFTLIIPTLKKGTWKEL